MGGINTGVPESWLLPLLWITVDGSLANNAAPGQAVLATGQMLASGIAAVNTPIAIGSKAVAAQQFGIGSMLEREINAILSNNPGAQLTAMAIPDPTGGAAAAGAISFTHAPTAAGTLPLYIAGQLVQVGVGASDTVATIATNTVAAINALMTLPATAAVDGVSNFKVNVTCQWKGTTGNDIQLGDTLLGLAGGQALPAGLTIAYTAMAGGTGVPTWTNAIAAIAPQTYKHVCMPYTDTGSLSTWATEFGFGTTGRWAYQRQQRGWIFNAYRNDFTDAVAFGITQNSPVITTKVWEPAVPTTMWEAAAAYCGQASAALSLDPARPLQTLEMLGVMPAPVGSRFIQSQQNTLAQSGFAVQGVAPDGNPMILLEAMEYQKNSFGQADNAFFLLTTLSTLDALLTRFSAAITSKFPRHKLAPDGTRFAPGQPILTPTAARAELVAEARRAEYDGLMTNVDEFKKNLVVQIDPQNQNRLLMLYPPNLIGQLRQVAVLAQFRLQAGVAPDQFA